jgi:ribosomal RNA-processing protein 7
VCKFKTHPTSLCRDRERSLSERPTSVQSLTSFLQKEKKQEEEAEEQKEDEEGWVKVTRGNKGTKARPHSEAANQKSLQKEIRKKKRKELLNFYTWQHRNTQKERESCCRAECIVGIMVLGCYLLDIGGLRCTF